MGRADNKNKDQGVSSDDSKESANHPVVRKAFEFDIELPSNPNLSQQENTKIQNAIKNEGIVEWSKTYVSEKGVRDLLKTDKKGAAMVINNAPKEDVKTYGNKDYLSTPETQKEIAKRREQARPLLEREYLDTSSKALEAFSKNPQLEKERTIQSDRNAKERPKIGRKIVKERNSTCSEVTGAELDDTEDGKPVAHHVERVSDNPDKFSEDENIVVVRNDEHREFHDDQSLPPNKEGLKEYRRRKAESVF